MMERLHEQRWAVTAALSDRTVTKLADARTLELADEMWKSIEEILPSLKSLKCATAALCTVSLSMVLPVAKSLLEKHLEPMEGESKLVVDFKRTVAGSLRTRVRPLEENISQGN